MRTRCILLAVFVVAALSGLQAQVPVPPPIPQFPRFGPTGVLPGFEACYSIETYLQKNRTTPYETCTTFGLTLPLVADNTGIIEVLLYGSLWRMRQLYIEPTGSMMHGDCTDFRIEGRQWLDMGHLSLGFGFAGYITGVHRGEDDGSSSAQTFVEMLLTFDPIMIHSGAQNGVRIWGVARGDYVLANDIHPGEDLARLSVELNVEPIRFRRVIALFVSAGATCTLLSGYSSPLNRDAIKADWHARAGFHAPAGPSGVTGYAQAQHISYPSGFDLNGPATLFSLGAFVTIAVGSVGH